jgi:hypothetical protein
VNERGGESRGVRCESIVPVGGGVVSLTPTVKERLREASARVDAEADAHRGAGGAGDDKGDAQDRQRRAAPEASLAGSVKWGCAVPGQGNGKAKRAGDAAWAATSTHKEDAGPGEGDVHSDAGDDGGGRRNAGEAEKYDSGGDRRRGCVAGTAGPCRGGRRWREAWTCCTCPWGRRGQESRTCGACPVGRRGQEEWTCCTVPGDQAERMLNTCGC